MIPNYLLEPLPQPRTWLGRTLHRLLQKPVQWFIWLFLSPRKGPVSDLSQDEVMDVYHRQAERYNATHHFTTRGQDTQWRREAGWVALNMAQTSVPLTLRILDLCTGTGLTVVEIANVLKQYELKATIVGLDLNSSMINVAKKNFRGDDDVQFVWGDATAIDIPHNDIDIVTHVFGIGGIPEPANETVFEEVLRVLGIGGQYYLNDMHRPIPSLPGQMPLGTRWLDTPILEAATYLQTTIPLALARLWGWRDTTLDFYLAPLATWCDNRGEYWGFHTVWFKVEPERWWFGLPVMPTARLLLEKVAISEHEYRSRIQARRDLHNLYVPI